MASAFEQNLANKQLISQSISGIRESGRNIQEAFQRGEELKQKQKETRRSALLDLVKTGASVAMPFIQEKYLAPMQDARTLALHQKMADYDFDLGQKDAKAKLKMDEEFWLYKQENEVGTDAWRLRNPGLALQQDRTLREKSILDALAEGDSRIVNLRNIEDARELKILAKEYGLAADASVSEAFDMLIKVELSAEMERVRKRLFDEQVRLYAKEANIDINASTAQIAAEMALFQNPDFKADLRASYALSIEQLKGVGNLENHLALANLYQTSRAESYLFLSPLAKQVRDTMAEEQFQDFKEQDLILHENARDLVELEWDKRTDYDIARAALEEAGEPMDALMMAQTADIIKGYGHSESGSYLLYYQVGVDGKLEPRLTSVVPEGATNAEGVTYTEPERFDMWYAQMMDHAKPELVKAFTLFTSSGEWSDEQLSLLRSLVMAPAGEEALQLLEAYRAEATDQPERESFTTRLATAQYSALRGLMDLLSNFFWGQDQEFAPGGATPASSSAGRGLEEGFGSGGTPRDLRTFTRPYRAPNPWSQSFDQP